MIHLFGDYRPHRGQAELHRCGARFVAVCAGVRSGKTHGAAREFLRRVWADRFWKPGPLRYWAVAPTHDLGEAQWREILSALGGDRWALVARVAKTDRRVELVSDITIEFKSAHEPRRLVGVGLDGLWLDEAARVHEDAWKGQLRMRLSDRLGWGLFSTTPLSRNWFFRDVWRLADPDNPARRPDYGAVRFTTADNTALPHLAAEVERARRELPARYFEREYLASFDAFIGQVYEGFDRKVHVCREADLPAALAEVRVGVDWGYRNPGAMVVVGRDGDGRWWALDERYERGLIVDGTSAERTWLAIARELAAKWRPTGFLCDPSRPEYIRALRTAGLPAKAAVNDILPGIQRIATLLHVDPVGGPALRILERCRFLLGEIPQYRWRDDGPALEEPLKLDDHALDALRYALCTEPHKPAFW